MTITPATTTTVQLTGGDIIEFTLGDQRRTAEVMLVTDDGDALLDLLDGDRPAYAKVAQLDDVAVFHPDTIVAAA